MLNASFSKYTLNFIEPGGTSRGVLHTKDTYFIRIQDEDQPDIVGLGECALFRGLSVEDTPDYEKVLADCLF